MPTIEEMERTLGINLDSPTLMFTVNKAQPGTEPKKSRKSSRRTTMMSSELNETLREIQNVADNSRRRSIRVAAQGKFYGSPSQISLEKENSNETEENLHPLLRNEKKWSNLQTYYREVDLEKMQGVNFMQKLERIIFIMTRI